MSAHDMGEFPVICEQCGQGFSDPACGPTHAIGWDAERRGLLRAALECEEGAAGPGVMFEMDGKLHALGESGVAALKYMAAQFRSEAGVAGDTDREGAQG